MALSLLGRYAFVKPKPLSSVCQGMCVVVDL
jgi:hypothetical protein